MSNELLNGAIFEPEIDFTSRTIYCSAPFCRVPLARCTSREHYKECESLRFCEGHKDLDSKDFVYNSVRTARELVEV